MWNRLITYCIGLVGFIHPLLVELTCVSLEYAWFRDFNINNSVVHEYNRSWNVSSMKFLMICYSFKNEFENVILQTIAVGINSWNLIKKVKIIFFLFKTHLWVKYLKRVLANFHYFRHWCAIYLNAIRLSCV